MQAAFGNTLTASAPAFVLLATARAAIVQGGRWSAAQRAQQAKACTSYPGPGSIARGSD
ncbi:MAG: hypothetical protein Q8P85_01885 [Pseudomonas sp.]|nr:hypothetical protein [Pseudomonas sp.]